MGSAVERDYVLLLLEESLVGAGTAVPFFVAEITRLLDAGQLRGAGLKCRYQLFTPGKRGGARLFPFRRLWIFGARVHVDRAKRLDLVVRTVTNPHLRAIEDAVRLVGPHRDEFQSAWGARLHAIDLVSIRPHGDMDDVALQHPIFRRVRGR